MRIPSIVAAVLFHINASYSLDQVSVELPDGQSMEFVWIEPGSFLMGSLPSEPGHFAREAPQHVVELTHGFYLGKFEVTQRQWETIIGGRPWAHDTKHVVDSADRPAVYVSWDDAQLFAQTMSSLCRGSFRLPTEAEYEYASRAGTTTRWHFGEDESILGDYAWYDANTKDVGRDQAQPVGTKMQNQWGLHDMAGNVYSWVQDWLDTYPAHADTNPTGPSTGSLRVLRGGYFRGGLSGTRAAFRNGDLPSYKHYGVGVRLVLTFSASESLIYSIEGLVADGSLNSEQGDGLLTKVDAIISKLDGGNTKAAVNQTRAFENQTKAFLRSGYLTEEEADSLLELASALVPSAKRATVQESSWAEVKQKGR